MGTGSLDQTWQKGLRSTAVLRHRPLTNFTVGKICERAVFSLAIPQHNPMVCIQHYQLPLQPDIHVLSGNCLQIGGQVELDADAFQAAAQDLTHRVEVPGELVHIGRRAVTGIVETHMGHTQMAEQLPELSRYMLRPIRDAVGLGDHQVVVIVRLSRCCHQTLLLLLLSAVPLEVWTGAFRDGQNALAGLHRGHFCNLRCPRRELEGQLFNHRKATANQVNIPPAQTKDLPHSQPIQAAQDDDKLPPRPHDICKQAPHLLHGIGIWGLALLPKLRDRVPGGVAVDVMVLAGV